jgi:hypothetical protein
MHIAYLAVASLAALMNGFAASMNFVGATFVKAVADKVQVSWPIRSGRVKRRDDDFATLAGHAPFTTFGTSRWLSQP